MGILRPDAADQSSMGLSSYSDTLKHLLLLKSVLNDLPELNFKTLKLHIEFFNEVIKYEADNKMNQYNISVTVGPNIFRPRLNKPKDLVHVGMYYELI